MKFSSNIRCRCSLSRSEASDRFLSEMSTMTPRSCAGRPSESRSTVTMLRSQRVRPSSATARNSNSKSFPEEAAD